MTDAPETRWARTVDGACIAYQDLGSGPVTLLVVHGWVSHLEVYWEQPRYVRFLRRLSRNLRVLVFDKRGIGMSDRVSGAPDLSVLLDDVRAVMDAAGVEKAALLGWGGPGPELAAFFAATYPERTVCFALAGDLHYREEPDYPWGLTNEAFERDLARLLEAWGSDAGASEFVRWGYGSMRWGPDGHMDLPPYSDSEFLRWNAKLARYSATPASYEAFDRMWFGTDVRPILRAVSVPTAVFFSRDDEDDERLARVQAGMIPGALAVPVATTSEVIWVPEPEPIVAAIERFIASVRQEEADLDRMLATVLFTDIVGSTDKACAAGDAGWTDLLEKHNATVRAFLARYRGNEIKTTGDGFLATFDGPARAVKCAQGICEAVRPLGIEVRAGCHTGEIELLGADVGGIAVHIGARVGALAGPSEVLVTSTVKDLVAGSGLAFQDRGEHQLKGVPEAWRLYALSAASAIRLRTEPDRRALPAITEGGTMSEMTPADLKTLERTPLFQTLPRRHRKRVAELATVKRYGNDEVIVRQGDPGDSFIVMLSGDVLVAPFAGDERLVVSDEYFGELSLIDGEPRAATVSAAGPVTVACIDREAFRQLLGDEPALAVGLLPGVALIARDLLRADAEALPDHGQVGEWRSEDDPGELAEAAGEKLEGRDALGWLLLLRHVGVFEALNEQHLRRVASLFTIERYADGDTVVLAGARGDSLHIVLNGRARVRTPGGHTRALGADDCFGELALIDGAPRSATVTAVGELTTAKLSRSAFTKLLKSEPGIAVGLLDGLVGIVRDLQRAAAPGA